MGVEEAMTEKDYKELKEKYNLLQLELLHYKQTIRSLHYCLNNLVSGIREAQQEKAKEFSLPDDLSIAV